MHEQREKLCKLVWSTLEWRDEGNSGNTYTYCFCTKYLPRLIAAAAAEPSPSLAASPYDLILRGACLTPLVQYYLRSRPDQAIALRDSYYKKCLAAVDMDLSAEELLQQLVPHLFLLHTCVVAYVGSPLSTATQKSPPFPFPRQDIANLKETLDPVWKMMMDDQGRTDRYHPWGGQVGANVAVFLLGLSRQNILELLPDLLEPAGVGSPTGFDFLACRALGVPASEIPITLENVVMGTRDTLECFERDPKKMKICSRCRVVYYCCTEHQKHDWEIGQHKPFCQKIVWDEL